MTGAVDGRALYRRRRHGMVAPYAPVMRLNGKKTGKCERERCKAGRSIYLF
jgi:hypothetical protein